MHAQDTNPTPKEKDPDAVLAFWLDELEPKDWYNSSDALDARIREGFGHTWDRAQEGAYSMWLTYPTGVLAYLIVTDQMPRNMFRGSGKSFASDRTALAAAKAAIEKGWDMRVDEPARQFFYLPLMHSERQTDQDRCVRLMCERLTGDGNNLLHARVHREIIRMFGRFPYRNEELGRTTSQAEAQFMADGGYATLLKEMQKVAA
ncbi:DUF924 family protein [Celeribacter marinus]|uniref:DUF924 family protein n=1 Tax=Celeribacter marinus TaxID=1397108 RepID=UPI00316D5EBF